MPFPILCFNVLIILLVFQILQLHFLNSTNFVFRNYSAFIFFYKQTISTYIRRDTFF